LRQNVICVKWGTKYPSDEVNALFSAVSRNAAADVRFLCLTDDPTGLAPWIETIALEDSPLQRRISEAQPRLRRRAGALKKVAVFNPNLIEDLEGPLLCLDIDILITGPLDQLFTFAPNKVCMPPPFKKKSHIDTKGEGSVIRFDPKLHGFLYDEILENTEDALAFSMGSEQRYTSFTADRHGVLENYPSEWIVSFMRSCRPNKPLNLFMNPTLATGAKIICFPSEPKAREAVNGFKSGLNSARPARWIADYL
jgi:hypothetical protein